MSGQDTSDNAIDEAVKFASSDYVNWDDGADLIAQLKSERDHLRQCLADAETLITAEVKDAEAQGMRRAAKIARQFPSAATRESLGDKIAKAIEAEVGTPVADIPTGVYWSQEALNFYDSETRQGKGLAFWEAWQSRRHEFPTRAKEITPKQAAACLLKFDATNGRDPVYDACANLVKVYKFDAVLRRLTGEGGSK